MKKIPTKFQGHKYNDFIKKVAENNEINFQYARLIPFYKPGDEISLTSIFLSGLRLIKEFRQNIFKILGLTLTGKVHIFTEIEFKYFDNQRIDGLILIERSGKIIDSIILEVKNKNNELNADQIQRYIKIAQAYKISKILTISNQFVNFPTQSPIQVRMPKSFQMYHFSWSYILTLAHILLFDNKTNIEDRDQIEIMNEILNYFESPKSGILGFVQMKPGWTDVSHKVNTGASLKVNDDDVDEAVSSWLEEERDMALILSKKLGLFVKSGNNKFKKDLNGRIKFEKQSLIKNKFVESNLNVEGAVSDIRVRPHFGRKNVEFSVKVSTPEDRNLRPQITWIKNQLLKCKKRNEEGFNRIQENLMLDIYVKFSNDPIRFQFKEIDYAFEKLTGKHIKYFNISYVSYFGKKFESRKLFISNIEESLTTYYQVIVQHLLNWKKTAPKVNTSETINLS